MKTNEMITRRNEIQVRLSAIADAMEAEKREMTPEEKTEAAALQRELAAIDLRIQASTNVGVQAPTKSREVMFDEFLREALASGKRMEYKIQREAIKTTTTNADATIPVTVEAVMKPLEEGLILNKVGLKLQTGLVGSYVIPGIGAITASVAGEGVEVADSEVTFDKLTPSPKRLSVSVKISNQLINQSAGVAYQALVDQVRAGLERVLNLRMFTCKQSISDGFVGPFKALAGAAGVSAANVKTMAQKKAAKHILFAGETPTYKEIMLLRTAALCKGVEYLNGAYVMDAATAGDLRCTPKGAGGGRMILEDGYIDGMPVFETNYINMGTNKNYVGFGFWGYQALGQFGDMRMIIDPYTAAKEDCVVITLNADWSMTTLRPEAFTIGECAGGGSGSGSGN